MIKLFITGTGTGVGKTVASAWLCRTLSELGKKVAYVKPVQTGGIPDGEKLLSVDEEYVKASAPKLHASECCVNFLIPASPHLVAAEENREIDCKSIIEKISDKLGILFNLTIEFVKSVEARIGSAEFFDPLILIFPLRGFPPNISITSIL